MGMLKCMIGSIVPLLWAGVLLLLLLMIFALIFVEAMIQFQNDHPNLDTGTTAAIQDNFGSVLTSMMALFQCMTGGEVWGPVYRLVSRSGPIYSSIFTFFITFFVFALF